MYLRILGILRSCCSMSRYTMNAEWLFSDDGETVVSDKCHGQLVVESDKLVTQEVGGNVDDNVNCCEKLSEVLQEMEVCDIMQLLNFYSSIQRMLMFYSYFILQILMCEYHCFPVLIFFTNI